MTAHVDKTVTSPKYTDINTFDYTSDGKNTTGGRSEFDNQLCDIRQVT